jgi:lysophospholipase L1-like esterase/mannose-6-phosphate isomerase-like protein (cupin superfamily)
MKRGAAGSTLALALLGFAVAAAAASPRQVFIVGDSTASTYGPERAPREGWGQRLQSYLDPASFVVRNHAQSGRSARSFIEEGWLAPVEQSLDAGDVLLIQFGHNDEKAEDPARYNEPAQQFPQWLLRYVTTARARGATPILLTPLARRRFDHGATADQLLDTHGLYTQAVRELARREGVGLIDLNASSMDALRALGDEASKAWYMHIPEQQQADDTHLQRRGAHAVACLVVQGWKLLDASLAAHVVRDTDCGARPTALADRAEQPHTSIIVQEGALPRKQPGPHGGPGETTAYPFFADAEDLGFLLRKRVLHPGSGIGLHQHDHDEIYYVVAGRGIYTLDDKEHAVGPGHALLTRPGSTHAIRQVGAEDLVLLISYLQEPAAP